MTPSNTEGGMAKLVGLSKSHKALFVPLSSAASMGHPLAFSSRPSVRGLVLRVRPAAPAQKQKSGNLNSF